jgi:ERCC4-type nuclease
VEKLTPTLLQDSREQCPLVFEHFPVEVVCLECGDYGVRGFSEPACRRFIIERKSLGDLCGSLGKGRDRFFREVELLTRYQFRALVIEAVEDQVHLHQYRSLVSPAAILSTLDALAVRAGLHVFWCGDPSGAAAKVESLARLFCRGVVKDYWRLTAVLEGSKKEAA